MKAKQLQLFLAATVTTLALLQTTSAFMSPMPMMGGPGQMMNPYNPYGYHVKRKRRHRNIFQRLTGTGRRYKYKVRPNSMLSGMGGYGSPYGGFGGYGGMHGGYGAMHGGYGMSPIGGSYGMGIHHTSHIGGGLGMGMGMSPLGGIHHMGFSGLGKGIKNSVRTTSALAHACRSNDTNSLRHVNCPYMSQHDINYCITRASEPFLLALVRKCKGVFTGNPYQMAAYGVELILANKPMPFGSVITRNTCSMMGYYEKKLLLKSAILSRTKNSYAFVDYVLNTCRIPLSMTAKLQTISLMGGDMAIALRLQRASMYPANPHTHQRIVYNPSGRIVNLGHDGALSALTGRDMAMFGKIGRACSYLRPEHLTHPLFNPELMSEMNENCFRNLRPRIFWYLTSDMIKRFRWWRSATPSQIRMIPLGKPIQAVPFFLLGPHVYVNKLDRYHPCKGITKTQRISIQMEPRTAKAFYERCRASNATAIKASASIILSALLAYFVFVA
jgi:hypothetical protein